MNAGEAVVGVFLKAYNFAVGCDFAESLRCLITGVIYEQTVAVKVSGASCFLHLADVHAVVFLHAKAVGGRHVHKHRSVYGVGIDGCGRDVRLVVAGNSACRDGDSRRHACKDS